MQTALVTGGTLGIGLATTELFLQRGWQVIVVARNPEKIRSLESQFPGQLKGFAADLADKTARTELISALNLFCSPNNFNLKALVNNAGQFVVGSLAESSIEQWEQQMAMNFFSVVELTRGLLPLLKKASPASIVNVSSTLGLRSSPQTGAYSASKAALQSMSITLAQELAPDIRVNVVCPGLVETPIHSFYHLPEVERDKVRSSLAPKQPMGRIGQPKEIAEAIYFLADSKLSAWTTGAILSVDGGINLV